MKAQLDANQKAITKKIRALVPDATAIIFYGSRVRGLPSPTSDYDVMVLTEMGMAEEERARVKEKLASRFPELAIDPVFGTERWLLAHLYMEPYYRFWLENAMASWGKVPYIENYPLLHRGALASRLRVTRSEIGVVQVLSRTLYSEGRGYLRILKNLILIEHALAQDYRNETLWADVRETVGNDVFAILRDSALRHRIRKPMVERLRRMVNRKISILRRQIAHAHLADEFPRVEFDHAKSQG